MQKQSSLSLSLSLSPGLEPIFASLGNRWLTPKPGGASTTTYHYNSLLVLVWLIIHGAESTVMIFTATVLVVAADDCHDFVVAQQPLRPGAAAFLSSPENKR